MITKEQLKKLDLNWSLVITTIYPDIGIVVKGDNKDIKSLLSVWETGNPNYEKPTEQQLLDALQIVENNIEQENTKEQNDIIELQNDLEIVRNAKSFEDLKSVLEKSIQERLDIKSNQKK